MRVWAKVLTCSGRGTPGDLEVDRCVFVITQLHHLSGSAVSGNGISGSFRPSLFSDNLRDEIFQGGLFDSQRGVFGGRGVHRGLEEGGGL
jgi:hypothetical protein